MKKTILITGSTDGIGLETAKALVTQGHHVIIHGRNPEKLEAAEKTLSALTTHGEIESYLADLSSITETESFASTIIEKHDTLDVLINNAGVYKTPCPITVDKLDARFAVNTIAPYLLTKRLLPLLSKAARVINLSSAAQSTVDSLALAGIKRISDDFNAYAQSKLALTMWSHSMALSLKDKGPVFLAVNPGSLLATKMVKEGFGLAGNDITVGSKILVRLALDEEFTTASGQYFDNDVRDFSDPHPEALDPVKTAEVIRAIESLLTNR